MADRTRMITFHIPEDEKLLAAFGTVALRHEHLTYILRMTIKTLAGLTPREGIDATNRHGYARLRESIRRLARQRLGEGQSLLKLQALMTQCERATDKRNRLLHNVVAKELDGEPLQMTDDQEWRQLPTVEELTDLADELEELTKSLNEARLHGFLAEALKER